VDLDKTLSIGRNTYVGGAMEAGIREHISDPPADPESLFRDNYTALVRSLAVASGDREAAADAVQEAFIQLCLHWKRVSRYDNPVAWVRRVAINRLINQQRSLRHRAAALLRLRDQQPQTSPGPAMQTDLGIAFASLPVRQRVAAALYYLQDLPVAEVARSMGISEGSVNTHLHRARAALRPTLEA
jgi:RNA polymerase sigma-70 factor (ECF subfamily)